MQHHGRALVHAGREQPVEVHLLGACDQRARSALSARRSGRSSRSPPRRRARSSRSPSSSPTWQAGKVDTLLMLGANPVYAAPADLDFAAALRQRAALGQPGALRRRDGARRAPGTCRRRTNTKPGAMRAPSTARSRSSSRRCARFMAAVRRMSCWRCCRATRRPTITRWCARYWQQRGAAGGARRFRARSGTTRCASASSRTAPRAPRHGRPETRSRRSSAAAEAEPSGRRRRCCSAPTTAVGTAASPTMPGCWRCRARSRG